MKYPKDFINKIIQGDCLEVMREIPDNSIDTIITDPPYGIGFMGKEWDNFKPKTVETRTRKSSRKKSYLNYSRCKGARKGASPALEAGRYDRSLQGQIGFQEWMTNIAIELLRVAKPGSTLLMFGGNRTYHRMACAIEDAGWMLKDCIMWIYGSGFPKATDVSKQLDKIAKAERKVTGIGKAGAGMNKVKGFGKNTTKGGEATKEWEEKDNAVTPEAQLWNGWKSHGLKPAYEPIIMAIKPNNGSYANNALKWGVAGLNIEECRIQIDKNKENDNRVGTDRKRGDKKGLNSTSMFGCSEEGAQMYKDNGRFPANIILDEEAAEMLDEQSGENNSGKFKQGSYRHKAPNNLYQLGTAKKEGALQNAPDDYGDQGGASRFFYVAKTSKAERNVACDGLEYKQTKGGGGTNNTEDDVCGKYGSIKAMHQNCHPTVKPLKLMTYLCNLTKTPTGGIILDPFAGSGATCMAAKDTDRAYIGIELELEYINIINARMRSIKDKLL